MNTAEQKRKEKREKKIGKLFIIAIGVNEYKNKDDNLNNCCTDAKSFFMTLKEKDYFLMDENSILVTSDINCTKKQCILDNIKACDKFIDEKTNIIFYYSGHGCNISETFHFFVSDSQLPANNLISIDDIIGILTGMNGGIYKSITLLIDACQNQINHSKSLGKQSYKFLDEYIEDAKGIGIIYSCSRGECSLDVFNKHNMSVFTYLLLLALNGHIDAVDGNCLTFKSLSAFLQLKSRKISRENTQINQHPQIVFNGNDIVYSYIPDTHLRNEDIEISVRTYDEAFMTAMFNLQNIASLVRYAKDIIIDDRNEPNMEVPSEKFIRQICEELSQQKLLKERWNIEILPLAFTYLNLIQLEATESLKPSVKMQIIDDILSLCNCLDNIYDRYIDRMY